MNTAALAAAAAGRSGLTVQTAHCAAVHRSGPDLSYLSTEARRQGQINLHRDYEDGSMYDLSREQGLNLRGGRGGSRVVVLSEPGLPWRPQIWWIS